MDDWGWDDGGYDYSYDYAAPADYDYGSFSPTDYSNLYQPQSFGGDIQSGAGLQYDPISNSYVNSQGGQFGASAQQPNGNWFTNALPTALGGTGGGWGFTTQTAGGGAGGGTGGSGAGGGGAANPWLAAALGTAGPLAGLIGTLASGGQTGSTRPVLGTNEKAMIGQSNQALQPFATGTSPVQQMQMSLLQALANGQGLPPGYAQLIEQAFQPQMGDLYTQAANQGRARGFHDAPATSPPGGAILGPGLSNIQGQMAQAKLGLMQSLPNLYNDPTQTAAWAASNQSKNLLTGADLGRGQTSSVPMGTQIGTGLGSVLQGAAAGYGGQQAQQAQQQTNNNLNNIYAQQQYSNQRLEELYREQQRNNSVNSSLSGSNQWM